MAKPLKHAEFSTKKYGGKVEDYLEFHTFFDSSKQSYADIRHRALLHSSFGIFLAEKIFGYYLTNSDGRKVSTRDLAEDHVIQDIGFIPTAEDWLKHIEIQPWMFGITRQEPKKITFTKFD